MSGFTWTEAMSVGVPALDADHRCLVRIIHLLDDADSGDVKRAIGIVMDALDVYCRYHFAREERIMQACGFPALAFHRREHQGFFRTIESLAAGKVGADAHELLEYLKAWLLHHVLIQDMAYKPYVVRTPNLDEIVSGSRANFPIGESCRLDYIRQ